MLSTIPRWARQGSFSIELFNEESNQLQIINNTVSGIERYYEGK